MTKEWFTGPHHLPKCWAKKPKATTKVTMKNSLAQHLDPALQGLIKYEMQTH